jgi:heat shock protein HtpX
MKSSHRAWLALALFTTLNFFIGYSISDRIGAIWGMTISLGIIAYSITLWPMKMNTYLKAQLIEGQDPWKIHVLINELSRRAQIPRPQIYVLDVPTPQLFNVGKNYLSGKIFLTTGLLKNLSEEDLRALLAYSVATLKRQSLYPQMMASLFLTFLLNFSHFFDSLYRWLIGLKNSEPTIQNFPVTYLFSILMGLILKALVTESEYFQNDKLASEYIESRRSLAQAYWKMDSYTQTLPMKIPAQLSHCFIINPLTNKGWYRYLHIQPSVKRRIENLMGHYPI